VFRAVERRFTLYDAYGVLLCIQMQESSRRALSEPVPHFRAGHGLAGPAAGRVTCVPRSPSMWARRSGKGS
jgi:hypothetical protein